MTSNSHYTIHTSRFPFSVLYPVPGALRSPLSAPRFTLHACIILLLTVILILASQAVPAAAQSPITAEVDRTSIAANEQVVLTVTVSGDLLTIPTPDWAGLTDFQVVGSSTSTQVSIINGQLKSQGIFVFRLQPLREGNLVIPPVSVELDGQAYQTQPIEIQVLAGLAPIPPAGEELPAPDSLGGQIFVEAEVNNDRPYLGQQLIYTFRFYLASRLLRQPDYQSPPFTNFWGQNILSQPHYNTTRDGRDFVVSEIRTALFPASIGQTTIDPAKLVIPGGLFEPDTILETEPISVDVQPLPEGKPADFNGAVGQFQIQTSLSETTGQVNEPLTLVVEIQGTGNIETLSEPAVPDLPNWRVFESQSSTKINIENDQVGGVRRFERLIVPGQPGDYIIPSISLSYFDPQAGAYRTTNSESIPITIRPDESEGTAITVLGADKEPVTIISGDIRHIKPVPTTLRSVSASMLADPLYWACWLAPLPVVAGVWVWQRRRRRMAEDIVFARRQTARRTARQILAQAEQAGTDSYALIQRALLGYLSDKLNRPTVGLTAASLTNLLIEARLDPALIERIQAALAQTDVGRFAPVEKAAAQALVAQTRRLIDELEKAFGRQA